MTDTNTIARSLHDVGLAAWFGGALMGAVGLNGAAAQAKDPSERARISTLGWGKWSPVNAAAIGAHLVGGAMIVSANRQRIAGQDGVATYTVAKTGVTVAALAATAASGYFGRQMGKAGPSFPVAGSTEPTAGTPDEAVKAQKALKPLQWLIPVLTGAILVLSARMGEQQRPGEVGQGLLQKVLPD